MADLAHEVAERLMDQESRLAVLNYLDAFERRTETQLRDIEGRLKESEEHLDAIDQAQPATRILELERRVAALEKLHATGAEEPHSFHARLRWTHLAPTEPGYYWMKWGDDMPMPVELFQSQDQDCLMVVFLGPKRLMPLARMVVKALWYGPIQPPE